MNRVRFFGSRSAFTGFIGDFGSDDEIPESQCKTIPYNLTVK
jgi:hypothetical protein